MGGGSNKRSWEVTPHSSGKSAASGTGALVGRPVGQPCSYEKVSRARYEDKQTSSYERYTTKEKASSGERHVERGSRQVGVRDEFKKSSTVKVGDKSGYTEYQVEERIRNVDFSRGSNGNGPNHYDNGGDGGDDGDYNDDYECGNDDDSNDYGDDQNNGGDSGDDGDCNDGYESGLDDQNLGYDSAPGDDCGDGGCSDGCADDDVPSDDCDGGCSDGGYTDDDEY